MVILLQLMALVSYPVVSFILWLGWMTGDPWIRLYFVSILFGWPVLGLIAWTDYFIFKNDKRLFWLSVLPMAQVLIPVLWIFLVS